jgi:hypothetical protein
MVVLGEDSSPMSILRENPALCEMLGLVSCSRYQLKKAGINHEWTETVRILSTHKTVSTGMQQTSDDRIEIRQCTLPEASAAAIYTALHIKEEPCRRRKFVWYPEKPPEKTPTDSLAINSG